MSFATAFLGAANLRARQSEEAGRNLRALMNRSAGGGGYGRAVRVEGGGDPLSRIRALERQRAEEERRQMLTEQQVGMMEEQRRQMELQNQMTQADMMREGVQPGVYRNLGPSEEQQLALRQQRAQTEMVEERAKLAPLEREAGERAIRRGMEQMELSDAQQRRMQARQNFIEAYANRNVEAMNRYWQGMYPGEEFSASFSQGPGGELYIQYPGTSPDQREVFDPGTFRQLVVYGNNPALEVPVGQAGVGSPAARAAAGFTPEAGGEAQAQAAVTTGSFMPKSWKEIEDIGIRKTDLQRDIYESARKYADSKVPRVDELGQPIEGSAEQWQQAYQEFLGFFEKPSNARQANLELPTRFVPKSQVEPLANYHADQFRNWIAEGRVPDPKEYAKRLQKEFGTAVAFSFMDKIKDEMPGGGMAGQPAGAQGLMERYNVRRTGEFAEGVPAGQQQAVQSEAVPYMEGYAPTAPAATPVGGGPIRPQSQVAPTPARMPVGPSEPGGELYPLEQQYRAGLPEVSGAPVPQMPMNAPIMLNENEAIVTMPDGNVGIADQQGNMRQVTPQDARQVAQMARSAPPGQKARYLGLLYSLSRLQM